MFAVINTNGVQYVVTKGENIKIPARIGEPGKNIEFDKILMFKENGNTVVGKPYVDGVKVTGVVKKHGKSSKVMGFKFTRRENYRRKHGHRQDFTEIEITDIIVKKG